MATNSQSRPKLQVIGTSRNPEYFVGSNKDSFRRDEHGHRLAPVSQLNTWTGRSLAPARTDKSSYSEGLKFVSLRPIREPAQSQAVGGLSYLRSAPEHSDRDHLPSQRRRSEPSLLPNLTRGSSHKGTTQAKQNPAISGRDSNESTICPDCRQSNSVRDLGNGNLSHICPTCKRFVFKRPTALRRASSHPTSVTFPNTAPLCDTCTLIPYSLHAEFLQFFPGCLVCGHMTAATLADLVQNGGKVAGLTDDSGREIWAASCELDKWCLDQAHQHWMKKGPGVKTSPQHTSSPTSPTQSLRRKSTTQSPRTSVLIRAGPFDQERMFDIATERPFQRVSLVETPSPRRSRADSFETISLDSQTTPAVAGPGTSESHRVIRLHDWPRLDPATTFDQILANVYDVVPERTRSLRRQPGIYPLVPRFGSEHRGRGFKGFTDEDKHRSTGSF